MDAYLNPPKGSRFCLACDRWMKSRECPDCGMKTEPAAKPKGK